MDWMILVLHAFWDSWLHERDVLLAQGRDHPTDGDATGYAAAYGVFIAAASTAYRTPANCQRTHSWSMRTDQ